jgi:hypothetical protein
MAPKPDAWSLREADLLWERRRRRLEAAWPALRTTGVAHGGAPAGQAPFGRGDIADRAGTGAGRAGGRSAAEIATDICA